jgi:hypothetical protein
LQRPEGPIVCREYKRSARWAFGEVIEQTRADGKGELNRLAFGPESQEKNSEKCFTALGLDLAPVAWLAKRRVKF